MNCYTVDQFGPWLQQLYPTKIVAIRLSLNAEPIFIFVDTTEQLFEELLKQHDQPFVTGCFDQDSTTREGSLLVFNDEKLEIGFIQSRKRRHDYRLFQAGAHEELKSHLKEQALPWMTFVGLSLR